MREFQERRRIKRLLHSRYAIGALALVCLLLIKGVWGVWGKYEKSKEIADRLQASVASLQTREASLQSEISSLGTPEGKERELRDRFGVVKEGEKTIVIIDSASTTGSTAPAEAKGWWARLWGFFGL